MITSKKGGASAASDMLLPGKAGGTVAVRRTLASTICRIADPTQVPRPRQLRDASTVMRFQPAHQSMINRRFDDRAPCLAWMSPKQALAGKPRIHLPASGIGGHESGLADLKSSFCAKLVWFKFGKFTRSPFQKPTTGTHPTRFAATVAGQRGTIRSAMSSVDRRCATITREIVRVRMASLIALSFSSSRWLVASSSNRMRGLR